MNLISSISIIFLVCYVSANPFHKFLNYWSNIGHTIDSRLEEFVENAIKEPEVNSSFIPRRRDWRYLSSVTGVKDQGDCSAGWAFAAVATIESQNTIATGNLFAFSEQQLIDCSNSFGNNGCNGGSIENAYKYVIHNGGIDFETSYMYDGKVGPCRFKENAIGGRISSYEKIKEGDEDELKKVVAQIGPVAVTIDASSEKFKNYKSGVFDDENCGKNGTHGVAVIGYGTEKKTGKEFWIVKNSWGENWGEKGYIRMSRNKNNQCGIASKAFYPIF